MSRTSDPVWLARWSLALGVLAIALSGCARSGQDQLSPLHPKDGDWPAIPTGQPLSARISAAGDRELAYLRAIDNRPDYSGHVPSALELGLIMDEYASLPDGIRLVLDSSVVGILLVDHFTGNAMSDFLVQPDTGLPASRFILFINADILGQSLERRLTERDVSTFAAAPQGAGLWVTAEYPATADGSRRSPGAVWYALSHEAAHLFDYVRHVTPFVEPSLPLAKGQTPNPVDHPFTREIWQEYRKPVAGADFTQRAALRFFGLQAAALGWGDLPATYDALLASPFVSLYGSQSWAEDWAELFTWWRLAEAGGQLRIELLDAAGAPVRTWLPLENPRVRQRFAQVADAIRQVE